MTKKITYCVHHPDTVATEKCSRCGNPICYNCEVKMFGRIYCSGQCLFMVIIKFFFKVLFWPLFPLKKLSRRGWVELVLITGLAVCLFFIWKLNRDIRIMEEEGRARPFYSIMSDTTGVRQPKVMEPTRGGMVTSNTITVSGQAESNRIISLSIDGKLKKVILPEKGRFGISVTSLCLSGAESSGIDCSVEWTSRITGRRKPLSISNRLS